MKISTLTLSKEDLANLFGITLVHQHLMQIIIHIIFNGFYDFLLIELGGIRSLSFISQVKDMIQRPLGIVIIMELCIKKAKVEKTNIKKVGFNGFIKLTLVAFLMAFGCYKRNGFIISQFSYHFINLSMLSMLLLIILTLVCQHCIFVP